MRLRSEVDTLSNQMQQMQLLLQRLAAGPSSGAPAGFAGADLNTNSSADELDSPHTTERKVSLLAYFYLASF